MKEARKGRRGKGRKEGRVEKVSVRNEERARGVGGRKGLNEQQRLERRGTLGGLVREKRSEEEK